MLTPSLHPHLHTQNGNGKRFAVVALLPLLAAAAPSRIVDATRRDGNIRIDGKLDEAAWSAAVPGERFTQREPNDGAPADFATEFRVLYDDHALYVGVRAHDPEPHLIRGLLTRRDQESSSDRVSINIDSFHDRRTAFTFNLNAAGVQKDYLISNDTDIDTSWDAVWEGAVSVDEGGWNAEFRIPLSQLRFSSGHDRWGLQVARIVQRTNEWSHWVPWPQQSAGRVSIYGELRGLADLEGAGTLELVPYGLGGGSFEPTEDDRPVGVWGLGLDGRFQLSSNFTLSATVNPDFGQVEADPSDVNLTATETFFPEKRPFFLEGADLFRFRLGQGDDDIEQLFYSRRIGAAPYADADDDAVGEPPERTTIYGAAKLTGKTVTGWSVGALNAVTSEESVRLPGGRRQILEPLSSYTVLSLRKDTNDGRTQVAMTATGVHRKLGAIEDRHEQAYAGGIELEHKFWEDEWELEANLTGSSVLGPAAAITETQEASQHYFQRPDADHLTYDPTRTSLHGFGAGYLVGKVGGGPWRGAIGGNTRSPGLEVNDLGFQQGADYAVQWAWLQARDDEPGEILRNYSVNFNTWAVIDYGALHTNTGGNVNGDMRLLNYWSAHGGVGRNQNYWDTGALRGGAAMRGVPRWSMWGGVHTDPRELVNGATHFDAYIYDEGDSYYLALSADLVVQALSNLEITLTPFFRRNLDDQQYVDTIDEHAIMARIDQKTLGATVRVAYTLSPTLSVQLYAQPFLSAGRYRSYRDVTAPRAELYSDRFTSLARTATTDDVISFDSDGDGGADFELERPDFSFRELRSNLVVRWEYLPGSVLFVVWSHARTSEDAIGRFDLGDDLSQLADEPGEHVVLLKLTYRFEI